MNIHHQYTNTKLDNDFQSKETKYIRHHKNVKYFLPMRFQIVGISIFSMIVPFLYSISYVTVIQMVMISTHYYIHNNILNSILPFSTFGIIFVFVTQLNHIQKNAISDKILDKPQDFVLHQMRSCVDYSYDNIIISSLTVFLNYQTYHHLFPTISHFHFLNKRKDIDKVILEYNSINVDGFFNIIKKYFEYILSLSFDNKEKET